MTLSCSETEDNLWSFSALNIANTPWPSSHLIFLLSSTAVLTQCMYVAKNTELWYSFILKMWTYPYFCVILSFILSLVMQRLEINEFDYTCLSPRIFSHFLSQCAVALEKSNIKAHFVNSLLSTRFNVCCSVLVFLKPVLPLAFDVWEIGTYHFSQLDSC